MRQVKVKRHQLLEKLKANRAGHRSIFEKAQIGYREQAVAELDAMLAEAKAGKRIRRAVSLDEPIDQTREYDRVIAMLEMSVDDEVELDAHSFQCYVLDQWEWSQAVSFNNSKYIKA